MIFTVTNRQFVNGKFTSDRNPQGNSWWIAPGKPLVQPSDWKGVAKDSALMLIKDQQKPVVVFVHGFNESAETTWGVMQALVDGFGDLVTLVGFLWNSRGSVLDYEQDRVSAAKSAGDLMNALIDLDCPDVIAHSMGNYVVQEALELVKGATAPYINRLVMVAADVDFNVLNTSNIAELSQQGTVMYSYRDGALWGSSDIHLAARLGMVGPGKECPKNFKGVNCTFRMPLDVIDPIKIHGYYFQWKEGYTLMKEALQ